MKSRKTNRAKAVDSACRNHGPCPWCRSNRLHQAIREMYRANDLEMEFRREQDAQFVNLMAARRKEDHGC